jgi:hypothetical protein
VGATAFHEFHIQENTMIFGNKSGRIGSFGKAVGNLLKPASAKTAAQPAPASVAVSAPTVEWPDFVDALATHAGMSALQAKAVQASGKFRADNRLWTVERTGYFDNKLLLRAQIDLDLMSLPGAHLLGVFRAAATAARLFACAMWLDDVDQTLQISWHVGDVTKLSTDDVIAAFEEARQVAGVVENALVTGLATDPSAAPAGNR